MRAERLRAPAVEPCDDTTIVGAFADQVARTPDRIAVTDESGASLTYRELDEAANRLASRLRSAGVRHEDRCALLLEPEAAAVVVVIAALKAGGAYVPIEIDTPPARIATMLADAGAKVVVSRSSAELRVPEGPWRDVDLDVHAAASAPAVAPEVALAGSQLAYVLFTSGTAGRPKGVMVEHASVTAFVRSAEKLYSLTADDRLLQLSSLEFDVSTFTIFGALLTGASVHLAARETRTSPDRLRSLMLRRGITVYMGTPHVLETLEPAELPDVRLLAVGGDAVPGAVAQRWRGRRFLNSYGPTEATVAVLAYECGGRDEPWPPIGKPMENHWAYVLDEEWRPRPPGAAGQLYVGGPGLARGYIASPGATAASFLPDPFAATPGSRMYATGDLVRELPSGDAAFLGRVDRQLKVHGIRVEPADVEHALRQHADVAQAVVDLVPVGETRELVSYVVSRDGAPLAAANVRAVAAAALPPAFVPKHVVVVERIPLTPRGKVDLDALRAEWEAARRAEPVVERPRTPLEHRVAVEVFAPVLAVPDVPVDGNFFELGGSSLQLLRLLARVRTVFGVGIPVGTFFAEPTVAGLAAEIEVQQAALLAATDAASLRSALAELEQGLGQP